MTLPQKEPLSRALRGRPFEHEEFMAVLYPDVVGSGGAPKRIMKPKRKGPDALPGSDDSEMPGTAILNLQVDQTFQPQAPQQQQQQQQAPRPAQPRHSMPAQGRPGGRPTSTTMPPRTNMPSTSALTPPDETASHTRKRFMPPQQQPNATPAQQQNKRRRISAQPPTTSTSESSSNPARASRSALEDSVLDLLRQRVPGWPEQALDIFFRDFSDEDMDLQLKIAEKALADESKALIFCKMPAEMRRHWVKRLREVHNRAV